jgi:1-pyrroline-5-carboxylate dehydrogenase
MATRLTYTTGSRSAELDRAFETALAEAREGGAEPLLHLVGGLEVPTGEPFAREDPSRREHVASRAHEGAELAAEAVDAAHAAQREWRQLAHAERVAFLRAAARLIDERKLELAAAISLEVGKVRTESIADRIGGRFRDSARPALVR